MPDLSIIIVTFQSQNEIADCLNSIYEKFKTFNYEIIIIDNNSKDKTVQIIREFYPNVNLLINKINLGYSKANNIAVSKSQSKYLFFLNPDTVIIRSEVKKMIEYMVKNKSVGVIGPKILKNKQNIQLSYGDHPRLISSFIELFKLGWLFKRNKFGNKIDSFANINPVNVGWVSGACMLIKKQTYLLVEGFDENIFMYGEDVDLCLRLKKIGYLIVFFPAYEIIHLGSRSSRQNRKLAVISGHNSKLYFYNKHYGKIHCIIIRMLLIISSLIKVLLLYILLKNDDSREKAEAHMAGLIELLRLKHL